MSSFKVWIDSPTSSNCLSESDYSSDTQRGSGFVAGTAASAIHVNSALRQANLVVAALMDSMNVSSSLNLNSSVTDVKTAIDSYFSTNFGAKVNLNGGDLKDTITTFTQAGSRANISSGEKTSISLGKISKYLNDLQSLAFKSSVGTSDIDNSAITSGKIASEAITTAKFASNAECPKATNATYAQYASSDTSKGTIEERLTRLGFKEATIYLSGAGGGGKVNLKRQGNYVIVTFDENFSFASGLTPVSIPSIGQQLSVLDPSIMGTDEYTSDFYPKNNATFIINEIVIVSSDYQTRRQAAIEITFYTDGTIYAKLRAENLGYSTIYGGGSTVYHSNGGYEANPIS